MAGKSKMVIGLIAACVVLALGASVLWKATAIGTRVFNFNVELRKLTLGDRAAEHPQFRWWNASWNAISTRFGLGSDIWLVRVVGSGFVAGGLLVLLLVLGLVK